jgi:DNA end-binding protein Ku
MLSPDGTPLKRRYVCPKDTEPLENDQIERGYEIDEGKFVVVTDEELESLAPRRSRDIELQRFVDRNAIDPAYFVRSYFLVPSGEQSKAYRLLAETMESSGRAGIATFVMRGKAYAVAIFAEKGILRAETLRFGDEVRSADDVGLREPEKVPSARVKAMERQVDRLAADELDESVFVDPEPERLVALARAKLGRREDVVTARPLREAGAPASTVDVIDLMALLKKRFEEGKAEPRKTAARPSTALRRAADGRDHGARRGATVRGHRAAPQRGSGGKRRSVTKRSEAHRG